MATRTLAELASSSRSLDKAFLSVRRGSNPRSCGPDGITRDEFARNWSSEKKRLRIEILEGTYRFDGYLGHAIFKKGRKDPANLKSYRPISVASIRDRVVQRSVLDAIWIDIRDCICTQSSFGGIRRYSTRAKLITEVEESEKKCIKSAAKRIRTIYDGGSKWVFESDIIDFYPSIDRRRLLGQLNNHLRDESLNAVIAASLDTSIVNAELMGHRASLWNALWGVPQGGVLSPALTNFYLFDFDRTIEQAGFQMVRYVDDFVILAQTEQNANEAYELCWCTLSKIGLRIHSMEDQTKTRVVSPAKPFEFLGLCFAPRSIRPVQKKLNQVCDSLREITDPKMIKKTLATIIQEINWLLQGFAHAYDFCNLTKNDLRNIDKSVGVEVRKWLERRGLVRNGSHINNDAFRFLGIRLMQKHQIRPIVRHGLPKRSKSHVHSAK